MSWTGYTVPSPPPDDTDTANFAFRLPDYGGDPNVWGYGLNGNWYVLDIILQEFKTDADSLPLYLPKAGGEVTGTVTFAVTGVLGTAAKPASDLRTEQWSVQQPAGSVLASCSEAGVVTAVNLVATSDARRKKLLDAEDTSKLLNAVAMMEPRYFVWNHTNEPDFGLIAQNVQVCFPHAIEESQSGELGIKQGTMTAVLAGAIKELLYRIESLEARLHKLEG